MSAICKRFYFVFMCVVSGDFLADFFLRNLRLSLGLARILEEKRYANNVDTSIQPFWSENELQIVPSELEFFRVKHTDAFR